MAKAFLVYGPRGAGKTTTTLMLAEALAARGLRVGGYFQRTMTDEQGFRGYDLVRVRDHTVTMPLARQYGGERSGVSTVCSFCFVHDAFSVGLQWLREDACVMQVFVIDEISKLEVRGEGHAEALRWALALDDSKILLLSVRADQLFYVVEAFALHDSVAGFMEIPAGPDDVEAHAKRLQALFESTEVDARLRESQQSALPSQ